MQKKKIVITVGGTGGHVFPAVALAQQLPHIELLFIGGRLQENQYFKDFPYSYKTINCGTLSFRKPFKSLKSVYNICKGIWQSRKEIRKFKPDLIIGFGSYHTLPTLFAGLSLKVPFVLHEANSIPGRVNSFFSKYAILTGVQFPETIKKLKGPSSHIALPLREGYKKGKASQKESREYFDLKPDKTTILVFGGSQGAHGMNEIVSKALLKLLKRGIIFQVIHLTGNAQTAEIVQRRYQECGIDCAVKAFEKRMDLAWQACDLMVTRSGAATIAEALEFEVPGFFIPYPHAMDNHQEFNADFMVNMGGAQKCLEKNATDEKIADRLEDMLVNNQELLNKMKVAIQQHKQQNHVDQLVDVVLKLL